MMGPLSNILVGIDFSEGSTNALRYAASLAKQTGARLHVLTVHSSALSLADDTYAYGFNPEENLNQARQETERCRVALVRLIESEVSRPFAGQVESVQYLREGEPRTELLKAISELGPDVLIVGSHGRGALARMMLGSVSTFLCHHCPIPLLVVPRPALR